MEAIALTLEGPEPNPLAPDLLAEVIRSRRSIRAFRSDPIPRELLEEVLELACWAPSSFNQQGWHFAVAAGGYRDRAAEALARCAPAWAEKLRAVLPEKAVRRVEHFFTTLGGAPVVVFAYAESGAVRGEAGASEVDPSYASACAAVQNLLLAAHARGLGACWVQAFCVVQAEVDAITGVEGKVLVGGIPLGWPDQVPPVPPRRSGRVRWLGFDLDSRDGKPEERPG